MRIISQNGFFDLPYDKCLVWICDTKKIQVSPIGETDSNYTFASYSTPEKAEKAMQLLHEVYSGVSITFKNEISEYEMPKLNLKGGLKNPIIVNVPKEILKNEYVNGIVFQFPKEEYL